ncbi:MAG: hypothetical protein JO246_15080 [Frankiaceae bacterium]|nr:hypothetical protein [Frankiaceae bacterium]MBV9869842.1 hypothetical protein [Frankiaceae bacterium]
MRSIPDDLLAAPFTAAMAAARGVTPQQLRGGRVRRLFHGVFVGAHVEVTPEVLAIGIALVLPPGAVVSHSTAALFEGADVRTWRDNNVYVTTLRLSQLRRPGIVATAAYLEEGDVCIKHGIPMTSPSRTAFDLARQRDLIERVVGIDAMLNRGGVKLPDLAAYVADRPAWRGIRWAREALTYAEPKSQSPMETRQRMQFILAGLPRPVAQHPVYAGGVLIAELDNSFPEFKVGTDWDGKPHAETWLADTERQAKIHLEEWWHRRYTKLSIASGWESMINEVRTALLFRGWRP